MDLRLRSTQNVALPLGFRQHDCRPHNPLQLVNVAPSLTQFACHMMLQYALFMIQYNHVQKKIPVIVAEIWGGIAHKLGTLAKLPTLGQEVGCNGLSLFWLLSCTCGIAK